MLTRILEPFAIPQSHTPLKKYHRSISSPRDSTWENASPRGVRDRGTHWAVSVANAYADPESTQATPGESYAHAFTNTAKTEKGGRVYRNEHERTSVATSWRLFPDAADESASLCRPRVVIAAGACASDCLFQTPCPARVCMQDAGGFYTGVLHNDTEIEGSVDCTDYVRVELLSLHSEGMEPRDRPEVEQGWVEQGYCGSGQVQYSDTAEEDTFVWVEHT
jgi:hypothetical protein